MSTLIAIQFRMSTLIAMQFRNLGENFKKFFLDTTEIEWNIGLK